MEKVNYKKIVIVVVIVVLFIFAASYAFKEYQKMKLKNKLVPFMLKYEGGLSRAKTDTASSNPAPWSYQGHSDWHTNKGVTYSTFKSLSSKLGYEATADNFFNMPMNIWYKILEGGYMGAYPLSEIAHLPRIQAVIITWSWGSGTGGVGFGSEKRLAEFQRTIFNIQDSNITKKEIIENFKSRVTPLNERKIFLQLCDWREADFKKMSSFAANGKGWLNRLEAFKKLFY